jgi:hypothetical protein
LARVSLGGTSQLIIIEVQDASGATSRLLVGTGPEGPRLVSELRPPTTFEQLLDEQPVEVEAPTEEVRQAAQASETLARSTAPPQAVQSSPRPKSNPSTAPLPKPIPPSKAKTAPPPPANPAVYASRSYGQVKRLGAGATRRRVPAKVPDSSASERHQAARGLIDEILASRKEDQWHA